MLDYVVENSTFKRIITGDETWAQSLCLQGEAVIAINFLSENHKPILMLTQLLKQI